MGFLLTSTFPRDRVKVFSFTDLCVVRLFRVCCDGLEKFCSAFCFRTVTFFRESSELSVRLKEKSRTAFRVVDLTQTGWKLETVVLLETVLIESSIIVGRSTQTQLVLNVGVLNPSASCVVFVTLPVMDDVILSTTVLKILNGYSSNTESTTVPFTVLLNISNRISRNPPKFTVE